MKIIIETEDGDINRLIKAGLFNSKGGEDGYYYIPLEDFLTVLRRCKYESGKLSLKQSDGEIVWSMKEKILIT